jgi:hypothetical protein
MNFFDSDWCALPWSPWIPFTADKLEFRQIPQEPGIYRIRPTNKDFLMYIGETRRTVHQRLNELRHSIKRIDLMPWNDPHTAAPSLWAWQDAEGFEYECSATPLDASTSGRRGMESFLLFRYRQEYGASTHCNFGRFHPRYRKSTNRKENQRGGRLEAGKKDNPAGKPSYPPLYPTGKPGDLDWMGLSWSCFESLIPETTLNAPSGPGLYILIESDSLEIIYIGQSLKCANRLKDHSRKSWDGMVLKFSYYCFEETVLPHQLKELENDLIGNYFEQCLKTPAYQFGNSK